MKIKMLKTTIGSENGFIVKDFNEGDIYIVHDDLANVFIADGFAELFEGKEEKKADPVVENKMVNTEAQTENKKKAKK